VGFRHLFGNGLPKNEREAAVMFEKACSWQDGAGCDGLGALYQTGTGVAADAAKAAVLYAKGCQLGYEASCKRQAGKAAAPPPASAPTGTGAATTECRIVRVQLGADTVASVERDIKARGGSPLSGGTGLGQFRLSALSGDYRDGGAGVMAVNYDFDASGPTGRLTALILVNHANSVAEYQKLLAARTAAATAIVAPLQRKSDTEFTAATSGCKLRFLPDAGTLYIHEVYELPN
jgi:TPR repeat protein